MTVYVCEQCHGTGQLPQGQRCPCREEDDTAAERRAGMRLEPRIPRCKNSAVGTVPTAEFEAD